MSRLDLSLNRKLEEAREVIELCKTADGFHASVQLYPELWIRDMVFSEDVLLKLGYGEAVRRHLEKFMTMQRSNGQVPNVITSVPRRTLNQLFHFWTSDSEILLVTGVERYSRFTGDSQFLEANKEKLQRALVFVQRRLNEAGLIPGMDWRDALPTYMNKFTLANQLLLLEMYESMGSRNEATSLKATINRMFYVEDRASYADYISGDVANPEVGSSFDCFGNSLAMIFGILPQQVTPDMMSKAFETARTPFGYRNLAPPCKIDRVSAFKSFQRLNAFVRNGAVFRNRPNHYQNSSIWPFVECKIIRGFLKLGLRDEAERVYDVMLRRRGMNEWYSPLTGEPKGSKGQLWTAASLLEANDTLSGA